MTLVVLLAFASGAEARNHRIKNTSTASGHENTVVQIEQKIVADNSFEMRINLDEWISARDNWEQDAQETVTDQSIEQTCMLEEWIISRDNWEQDALETVADHSIEQTSVLEDWIISRDKWEQEGQETGNNFVHVALSMME